MPGLLHPVHHLPADCSIMIHSFYHSTLHYSIILFYHSILSLNHPIMLHSARQILARWTGCARLKTRRRGAQCAAGLTTAGKKSELAERADQRLGQRSSSAAPAQLQLSSAQLPGVWRRRWGWRTQPSTAEVYVYE